MFKIHQDSTATALFGNTVKSTYAKDVRIT